VRSNRAGGIFKSSNRKGKAEYRLSLFFAPAANVSTAASCERLTQQFGLFLDELIRPAAAVIRFHTSWTRYESHLIYQPHYDEH
jgi:hypothetical protein